MNLSKGIPLEDRVLIKPKDAEDKIGDYYIGEKDKEKPVEGTVIAVGEGVYNFGEELLKRILIGVNHIRVRLTGEVPAPDEDVPEYKPMKVEKGDYVLYGRHAGTPLRINEENYIMIRQADIFMVLPDTAPEPTVEQTSEEASKSE